MSYGIKLFIVGYTIRMEMFQRRKAEGGLWTLLVKDGDFIKSQMVSLAIEYFLVNSREAAYSKYGLVLKNIDMLGDEKMFLLKKCNQCGAVVKVFSDCDISCCGVKMKPVVANSEDAVFEKHVPTYEIEGDRLIVTVHHVMEQDHFIEWIALVSSDREEYIYLEPGKEAKVDFPYQKDAVLYAYCNKHGLWKNEIL